MTQGRYTLHFMGTATKSRRSRGSIDQLPSGAYRVRVSAGQDPITGERHMLVELADSAAAAEKLRTRLLSQVDERRNPRTKTTVEALMERYREVMDVGPITRRSYEGFIANHIVPALGGVQVAALDAETLDRFYAQLRTCRVRCRGRVAVDHRVKSDHDCDVKCRPHACRPLGASGIRQIHWILSGALNRAVRWRWIAVSPAGLADPPAPPAANPRPTSNQEAARILMAFWEEEPMWGVLVWLVMTTGMRRGEICALRRRDVDLDAGVLTVAHSKSDMPSVGIKDTKTHQQRRITIEPETVQVLRAHFGRQDELASVLGVELDADTFMFSYAPAADSPMNPSGVSHRYGRMMEQLGISTTLHKLRHYNATELIAAGVDIRTVAGRLGHGGGGTTTLRVYAAWVSEADQRASKAVTSRMPRLPVLKAD